MMDGEKVKRTIKELIFSEQNKIGNEIYIEGCNFVFKENYYEYKCEYSDYDDAKTKIEKKIDWIIKKLKKKTCHRGI